MILNIKKQLQPCPHCGGEAVYKEKPIGVSEFEVACSRCGVRLSVKFDPTVKSDLEAIGGLVNEWNIRCDDIHHMRLWNDV